MKRSSRLEIEHVEELGVPAIPENDAEGFDTARLGVESARKDSTRKVHESSLKMQKIIRSKMLAVNKNKTTRKSFERQITQFKSMKFVNALSKAKQLYVDNGLDEGNELNMLKEAKALKQQREQRDLSKMHRYNIIKQLHNR